MQEVGQTLICLKQGDVGQTQRPLVHCPLLVIRKIYLLKYNLTVTVVLKILFKRLALKFSSY